MSDKNKRLVKVLSLLEHNQSAISEKLKALDEREDNFRVLFENLPVMFYAVEPHPPFAPFYVSPAFAALGYPLEEWENNPDMWLRVIHPEDCKRILEKTEAAMLEGRETNYEYRVITRDGSVRWVRDCGRFVRDAEGRVICWQGVMLDVTDRKEALEELRESEARYRNLFENASDLIYVHDLAGNYISVNQAAERVFGIPRAEALKMNIMQVVAPEHLRLTQKMMAEKIASGAQTVYEVVCLGKDGRRITLEVNSSVIYKNGMPVGVQGIARDVTERKRTEDALRESEKRSRDLFENANDLIYTHDLKGGFTSLNRAGERITGYTREEVVGTGFNFARVVAPEYLQTARQMIADKLAGKPPCVYELEIIAKNGQRVSLELSTRLISRDGKPVGVQGIGRDITERKRAENSLHRTVSLLTSTLESSNDGIVVINLEGEIVVYNRKFLDMWHIPAEVIAQNSVPELIEYIKPQLKDPKRFEQETAQLYEDPLATCLQTVKFKDGRVFERYSQPQFQEGVSVGRVCAFRDITERVRAEEKLLHYARHDALTNLPNRAEFMNHLESAVERSRQENDFRFAVLFLDIDRFKVINDSLGHVVGDKLLMAIAKRLEASVRPRDIVARLGGDEFTVLLNRSGEDENVAEVAERIQNALAEPFTIDNYEIFTSASIGVIISDEATTARQAEDYLRDADTAMYRAKESGKARFEIFDHAMHVRNMSLLRVENDLRKALDRNEFRVFYQPIANLRTGEIEELEALIRWQHPEYGLITPNEFIGVAEETGLIIPIGKWILEEACRQITVWQNLFPRQKPLSVSVNLSAKQLMHPTLTAQVREILAKTGLRARYLNLEVTETTVMEHSETALNVLNDFSALGISLSTDDFGTGYSSLSYLHRFPFNRLKIDRSFVNKMDSDAKSGEIVRTILMLAQNLHLEAVAEGIETEEQLRLLQSLGCGFGQGYLFSKPVSVAEVEKLLSKGLNFNILRSTTSGTFPIEMEAVFEVAEVQ